MQRVVEIYVINLARREDRLKKISECLSRAHLAFNRIEAVDGRIGVSSRSTAFASKGNQACWESHQLAFRRFIESKSRYALILEDDADVSHLSEKKLADLCTVMEAHDIGVLQIGFVSKIYRFPRMMPFILKVASYLEKRVVHAQGVGSVVFGEFRAGTHSYLVNIPAAEDLIGANIPAVLAADGFLGSLALANGTSATIKIARLTKSLVEQTSRSAKSTHIDTDIW
jgi:GR25 family glycosyltransferase involved in LPS biosynthesis